MEHDELKAAIAEAIAPLQRDLAEMKLLMTGNGQWERGIIVRLDRLEQAEQKRAKVIWAMFTTALAALAAAAAAIFK